jgi:hypothetical protein
MRMCCVGVDRESGEKRLDVVEKRYMDVVDYGPMWVQVEATRR